VAQKIGFGHKKRDPNLTETTREQVKRRACGKKTKPVGGGLLTKKKSTTKKRRKEEGDHHQTERIQRGFVPMETEIKGWRGGGSVKRDQN